MATATTPSQRDKGVKRKLQLQNDSDDDDDDAKQKRDIDSPDDNTKVLSQASRIQNVWDQGFEEIRLGVLRRRIWKSARSDPILNLRSFRLSPSSMACLLYTSPSPRDA